METGDNTGSKSKGDASSLKRVFGIPETGIDRRAAAVTAAVLVAAASGLAAVCWAMARVEHAPSWLALGAVVGGALALCLRSVDRAVGVAGARRALACLALGAVFFAASWSAHDRYVGHPPVRVAEARGRGVPFSAPPVQLQVAPVQMQMPSAQAANGLDVELDPRFRARMDALEFARDAARVRTDTREATQEAIDRILEEARRMRLRREALEEQARRSEALDGAMVRRRGGIDAAPGMGQAEFERALREVVPMPPRRMHGPAEAVPAGGKFAANFCGLLFGLLACLFGAAAWTTGARAVARLYGGLKGS